MEIIQPGDEIRAVESAGENGLMYFSLFVLWPRPRRARLNSLLAHSFNTRLRSLVALAFRRHIVAATIDDRVVALDEARGKLPGILRRVVGLLRLGRVRL